MAYGQIIIGIIAIYLAAMLPYRFVWVKPNIKISFPEDSDTICLIKDQIVNVTLEIVNIGITGWKRWFSLRKRRTVHNVSIQLFLGSGFDICKIERQGKPYNQIFRKADGTIFAFIPDVFGRVPPAMISLGHGEKAECQLTIRTPRVDGRYPMTFSISSRQGSLSCKPLYLYVMTIHGIMPSSKT